METILEHGWKEKSVKLQNWNAMFLKSNQDIVLQRHRIIKMFVWWGCGVGEQELFSHLTNVWKIWRPYLWSNIFAHFGHITVTLCKFSNFKVVFLAVPMDFWSLSKLNKQKGLLKLHVKSNITRISKVHVSNICSNLLFIYIYIFIVCLFFFCLTVTVEGSKTNYIQFARGFFK